MALLVNPPNAQLPLVNTTSGAPALGSGGLAFLQGIVNALNGTQGVVASGVNQITLGIGINVSAGAGSPNTVVSGSPGDLYLNTSGGANQALWVKESGVGTKTGWAAK